MKPRSHRNKLTRLTARERAHALQDSWPVTFCIGSGHSIMCDAFVHVIESACRATLARAKARKFRPWTPKQLERAVAAMPVRVERRRGESTEPQEGA